MIVEKYSQIYNNLGILASWIDHQPMNKGIHCLFMLKLQVIKFEIWNCFLKKRLKILKFALKIYFFKNYDFNMM